MNILVLLTINFYAPLQIQCTKLILHLGSTLQKLTLLKMTVFQSAENFVWGGGGGSQFYPTVSITSWGEWPICLTVLKILRGELQFRLTVSKNWWGELQFLEHYWRKNTQFWKGKFPFIFFLQKTSFEFFKNVFGFQVILWKYFVLWYFILTPPIFWSIIKPK